MYDDAVALCVDKESHDRVNLAGPSSIVNHFVPLHGVGPKARG